MKIKEALDILNKGNPVIHHAEGSTLPEFSTSKGERYWFSDVESVSEDELVALFGLAIDQTRQSIEMRLGGYSVMGMGDCSVFEDIDVFIGLNENKEFFLPYLPLALAESIYTDRSNGYCDFNGLLVENEKFSLILDGELCLDELLAIYTIAKHKTFDNLTII